MKSSISKILITVALLLVGARFALAQGDAELVLKSSSAQALKGEEFTVDVILKNPEKQSIISVRSWLNYDPAVLEAVSIDTRDLPFTLSAPGEDNVSASESRVKIGRSNIAGGVTDSEAKVATVHFRVLGAYAGQAAISFYDYQISELGHTSVNIIDEGFPLNILSKEPESIKINLNPGAATGPAAVTPTPVVPTPVVTETPAIGGGVVYAANLARPVNLRANTGSGYVDMKWDAPSDLGRVGFNIYYGKGSGQYTRRHSIGNVDNYRLDDLNNNETYYFAVTAYDQLNQESDYSNEVGVIVNQPLSSTSPFEAISFKKVPEQPQNGPLIGWLIFSAVGLSSAILFSRKKQRVAISNI